MRLVDGGWHSVANYGKIVLHISHVIRTSRRYFCYFSGISRIVMTSEKWSQMLLVFEYSSQEQPVPVRQRRYKSSSTFDQNLRLAPRSNLFGVPC